jgi:nucleoid-associated protein YgaU
MRKILIALVTSLLLAQGSFAADGILKPGHPERYIVKQGDTLWDISSMFLSEAWRWPEIWQVNPDIANPHLIYPGDEILLRYVNGEPQLSVARGDEGRTVKLTPTVSRDVKMSPKIRSEPLTSSISAIPLDAIANLLKGGRVVGPNTLDQAPHILAGKSERLIFGAGDEFYARGDWPAGASVYGIFRPGEVYIDPETEEVLGYEAQEIGVATILQRDGDVVTMSLTSIKEEVRIGDRLLPTEERRVESMFYPAAPAKSIEGVVMTVLGQSTMVGKNHAVAINRGNASGLSVGNVLAIYKKGATVRDEVAREQVRLPAERVGLLMVFRVFDKMSYGLILQTEEPIRVGDLLRNP